MNDQEYVQRSVELAIMNAAKGGEPFGAVLVRDGEILAEAVNEAHVDHDPTAHAEIQALRRASRELRTGAHPGSTMYASGKPCAMCTAAMILAGVTRVVYSADDDVGGAFGFSTEDLYARMRRDFGDQGVAAVHLPVARAAEAFRRWSEMGGKA